MYRKQIASKVAGVNPALSIITLNVNLTITLIKRQKLYELMKKTKNQSTEMRYKFISTRMTRKKIIVNVGENVKKYEPSYTTIECYIFRLV